MSKICTFKSVNNLLKLLISRQKLQKFLQNQFDFDIFPINIQNQARNIVAKLQIDDSNKISDKMRLVLKSDLYEIINFLPDKDICKLLKSSHSIFSLIKNQI